MSDVRRYRLRIFSRGFHVTGLSPDEQPCVFDQIVNARETTLGDAWGLGTVDPPLTQVTLLVNGAEHSDQEDGGAFYGADDRSVVCLVGITVPRPDPFPNHGLRAVWEPV